MKLTIISVVLSASAALAHSVKIARKRMWTENNDGITLPDHMDTSEHCAHALTRKGALPGGRLVVTCDHCGAIQDVTREIWDTLR